MKEPIIDFLLWLKEQPIPEEVEGIVLFGSQSRGDANLTSDVDLAIYLTDKYSRITRLEMWNIVDSYKWGKYEPEVQLYFTKKENLKDPKKHTIDWNILKEGYLIYGKVL